MPADMPAHIPADKLIYMPVNIPASPPVYILTYTRQFPSQYSSQLASPYARPFSSPCASHLLTSEGVGKYPRLHVMFGLLPKQAKQPKCQGIQNRPIDKTDEGYKCWIIACI